MRLAEDREYWQSISDRGREVYRALPDAGQKWDLQKNVILKVAAL